MVRRETIEDSKKDEIAIKKALAKDKKKDTSKNVIQRKERTSKARPEFVL